MVTRKELAKRAAKLAAIAAYETVMNTGMNKLASSDSKKLTVKDVATLASKAAYDGVVKSAQMMRAPLNFGNIQYRLQKTAPQFTAFLKGTTNTFGDLKNFVDYIVQPVSGKESWANPSRWEEVKAVILADTNPNKKQTVDTALKSFDATVQAAAVGQKAPTA